MDSGPGIPVDERNRIFEAFYQGKTPQGGHVKGTGIGLSVVTEFVNAHGGSIEILEAPAGGAIFACVSPCAMRRPPNVKRLMRLRLRRSALSLLTLCALCGCAAMGGSSGAKAPPPSEPDHKPEPGPITPLLDLMSALPRAIRPAGRAFPVRQGIRLAVASNTYSSKR